MKSPPAQWVDKLRERVPEPQILLAPGHLFFGRRFDTPPDLPGDEIHALLELSLEGVSPFPLENLAWGYLRPSKDPTAYVYATTQARLREALGEREPHEFYYAFPGFLTQFGITFSEPTVRFLAQNGSVSAIQYAANDPQPLKVWSHPITAELLSPGSTLEARDTLARELPTGISARIEDGVWVGEGHTLDERGRLHFHHQHHTKHGAGESLTHTLAHAPRDLWRADLRENSFQQKEQKARALSERIWGVAQILAVAAVLMLVLQLTHWGLGIWHSARLSKVGINAEAAEHISESMLLATRISEAVERSLQPIRMLELVNGVRPDPIFFNRTRSITYNQLIIEGESRQGIPTVNTYATALKRLPSVLDVEQSAQTQGGRTRFEMTITFTDEALLAPATTTPEAAEEETTVAAQN